MSPARHKQPSAAGSQWTLPQVRSDRSLGGGETRRDLVPVIIPCGFTVWSEVKSVRGSNGSSCRPPELGAARSVSFGCNVAKSEVAKE